MAQILVRNLSKKVVARLKERAKKDHQSLQAEVKAILEQAANEPKLDMEGARKISEHFQLQYGGRKFPDSTMLIREDRNR